MRVLTALLVLAVPGLVVGQNFHPFVDKYLVVIQGHPIYADAIVEVPYLAHWGGYRDPDAYNQHYIYIEECLNGCAPDNPEFYCNPAHPERMVRLTVQMPTWPGVPGQNSKWWVSMSTQHDCILDGIWFPRYPGFDVGGPGQFIRIYPSGSGNRVPCSSGGCCLEECCGVGTTSADGSFAVQLVENEYGVLTSGSATCDDILAALNLIDDELQAIHEHVYNIDVDTTSMIALLQQIKGDTASTVTAAQATATATQQLNQTASGMASDVSEMKAEQMSQGDTLRSIDSNTERTADAAEAIEEEIKKATDQVAKGNAERRLLMGEEVGEWKPEWGTMPGKGDMVDFEKMEGLLAEFDPTPKPAPNPGDYGGGGGFAADLSRQSPSETQRVTGPMSVPSSGWGSTGISSGNLKIPVPGDNDIILDWGLAPAKLDTIVSNYVPALGVIGGHSGTGSQLVTFANAAWFVRCFAGLLMTFGFSRSMLRMLYTM